MDAVTGPAGLRVQKLVNIIGNAFLRPTMKLQLLLHQRFPPLLHLQMHRSLLLLQLPQQFHLLVNLLHLVDAVVIHRVHIKS